MVVLLTFRCAIIVALVGASFHDLKDNLTVQKTDKRTTTRQADAPGEAWGYVDVRPHAHMFWWLYYTSAPTGHTTKPLVIWLQGGPGGSSTGFGNFQELGPLDVNLKPRKYSWVSEASVLFIDNPVGAGFSYVTDDTAYTRDVQAIAQDLLTTTKHFLNLHTDFQSVPLYIFSESYGGKMTAVFAQHLLKAVEMSEVSCKFSGIAMGDSWISPIDSVLTWAPYLYHTSLVGEAGLGAVGGVARECEAAVKAGEWSKATALWQQAEEVIANYTNNVNLYNILQWGKDDSKLFSFSNDDLSALMNGQIRQKLGIIPPNVTWGGQSGMVFETQRVDFMKPVVVVVDELLKNSDLKVVVYSGQLDLIVDTIGTERWVQNLTWPGLKAYNKAWRMPVVDGEGHTAAFVKSYKNFSFYWILDAGHMIPADQPRTALEMLKDVLS